MNIMNKLEVQPEDLENLVDCEKVERRNTIDDEKIPETT